MASKLIRTEISSEMIEKIYQSALCGDFLDLVLNCVTKTLGDIPVTLFGVDTQDHRKNFFLQRGLCTEEALLHINKLMVDNPWLNAQWRQPVGVVYQDDDLLPQSELHQWSKRKEWNAVLSDHKFATGIVIYRSGTRQLALEVHYNATHENRFRRAATECLDMLAPHLLLGEQITTLRREFPIDGDMATSLLELTSLPVIIVSSDNRVQNMNARAEILATQLDAFFISAERQFHAMDLESEAAYQSALHALTSGSRKVSDVITLWNGDRSRHVFMALAKLGGANTKRAFPVGRFESGDEYIALIIQDVNEELDLSLDTLWRTFRLSNAEAELARRLLRGDTVGDVAFDAGVSKQTLRNQLSSIMKKTSTSRQAQLISLLTKLAVAPKF